ncbi:ATP-dependent helicase [Paenibacillus baekrokdamisoli]|uniref:ATP-dependent helicase n=1 Tax=Paenibacillus baekrokdamisoli TaxID=1712516 RepID=A0A3G9J6S5_9BACL|nr:DEAD/DEAH box helicase [Paenibacillus baekrokdamisoli]MBB3069298.1 SNF2 family DNA or RNA helicase [Paenibacillus baekrokdamisoli]BBH18729.1 ATP-dependent helicase [Paenibacillus baekrokdamisoli]
MRGYTGAEIITIDGYWKDGEGIIIAVRHAAGLTLRLRQLLFAWHEASWYGSEVEERVDERLKITEMIMTPLHAMDYLASPESVRLLQTEWTTRAMQLHELAKLLRQSLLKGWYAPDWSGWTADKRAWKLEIPASELDVWKEWKRIVPLIEEQGDLEALRRWLSEIVEELIATDEKVAAVWRAAVSASGEGAIVMKATDEDDWLVSIGLKQDNMPFRTALQLLEPNDEYGWRLRPALQDRAEGGRWVTLEPAASRSIQEEFEDFSSQDAPLRFELHPDAPEEWIPFFEERMRKEEFKWASALPEWIESAPASSEEIGEGSNSEQTAGTLIKTELSDSEAWDFLERASVKLLAAGSSVLLPSWWEAVRSRKLRLKAKVKSSVGSSEQSMFGLQQIVDFDWKLAVGNVDMSEAEFMRLADENRRLMQIGGEWVHLDPDDVERLRKWLKKNGGKSSLTMRDVMEMHLRGTTELGPERQDEDDTLTAEVELNEHLTAWISKLNESSELPLVEKPAAFQGELRHYQLQGVSWLAFLRKFGLGGCLADDMGLGKTIQFTAYLQHVLETGVKGPSLLICPTSVIGNWEKELERFAPTLRVLVHYGPRRARGEEFTAAAAEVDLVITSYALAPLDEEELSSIQWDVFCLDEAQNIKNYYTKQSAAIRGLPSNHRIALTGTPMENRLTELWSLYDFTNPGYLGSLGEFRKAVVLPIERERDEALITELQRWVKPFMLRRVKKDPAIQLSLPEKNETRTYLSLTVEQGTLYENIVSDLLQNLESADGLQRRGLILSALTRLKQVCNHPSLLLKEDILTTRSAWDPERSNKVLRVLEMVEEIAAEGERCLIFTQYVEMGMTLKRLLEERIGLPTPFLYGGVPKAARDKMIEEFQDEKLPGCAFVLSLKAGGTGLNLTAANHVIHFDRWWNPAVENQATDRAFRIGQTRNVQVHKYVTLGTLEERIDDMITRKQMLNDQVVGQSENWITEMSTDELRELFTLRKQRLKG